MKSRMSSRCAKCKAYRVIPKLNPAYLSYRPSSPSVSTYAAKASSTLSNGNCTRLTPGACSKTTRQRKMRTRQTGFCRQRKTAKGVAKADLQIWGMVSRKQNEHVAPKLWMVYIQKDSTSLRLHHYRLSTIRQEDSDERIDVSKLQAACLQKARVQETIKKKTHTKEMPSSHGQNMQQQPINGNHLKSSISAHLSTFE